MAVIKRAERKSKGRIELLDLGVEKCTAGYVGKNEALCELIYRCNGKRLFRMPDAFVFWYFSKG